MMQIKLVPCIQFFLLWCVVRHNPKPLIKTSQRVLAGFRYLNSSSHLEIVKNCPAYNCWNVCIAHWRVSASTKAIPIIPQGSLIIPISEKTDSMQVIKHKATAVNSKNSRLFLCFIMGASHSTAIMLYHL